MFTGDIVLAGGHPVTWAGPVANWIAACDRILDWDVETLVPAHGPIIDKAAVHELRDYLAALRDEARARYDAGLTWTDASEEIVAKFFAHWIDRERAFINVNCLHGEFAG